MVGTLIASGVGLAMLVAVFFLVPVKNSQLRVLIAVLAGFLGYFIAWKLLG